MPPVPAHLEQYSLLVPSELVHETLTFWQWLVPMGLKPTLATKFGDWILEDSENRLHFLDLLEGFLVPLEAQSQDLQNPTFSSRFKDQLSVDWVEVCLSHGMMLGPEECYGWKIHPMIGGPLTSANIQTFSFKVYESLNSQLHQQLRGRPGNGQFTGYSVQGG